MRMVRMVEYIMHFLVLFMLDIHKRFSISRYAFILATLCLFCGQKMLKGPGTSDVASFQLFWCGWKSPLQLLCLFYDIGSWIRTGYSLYVLNVWIGRNLALQCKQSTRRERLLMEILSGQLSFCVFFFQKGSFTWNRPIHLHGNLRPHQRPTNLLFNSNVRKLNPD